MVPSASVVHCDSGSGKAVAELIVDGESWGEFTSLELLRLKNVVDSKDIYEFLDNYFQKEDVEEIVIGKPVKLDGTPTNNTQPVEKFVARLKKRFPSYPVVLHDERLTSKMALDAMIAAGTKKNDRRQKGNIDKLSAVIILESYLESKAFGR